ncbi:MAG: penicillin-binding protein 2 [Hyphomicrobiaceae bacterium]|nr:penicillin-binding protein 2 [Hyphomicrobiaceae bacterium]
MNLFALLRRPHPPRPIDGFDYEAPPEPARASPIALRVERPRGRVLIGMMLFTMCYGAVIGRLVMFGIAGDQQTDALAKAQKNLVATRPDIVDRNGEVLATDIKAYSLIAEPRKIIDVDEAQEALVTVFPELGTEPVRKKLASRAGFVWLKREITDEQRRKIHRLGIPGLTFATETRRFYPGGPVAGHILGTVNDDNAGIVGIEKYIDEKTGVADLRAAGFAGEMPQEPQRLSIDLRVQHVVRDEIARAKDRYRALAAVGIVIDVRTGEIIAMSSYPDFDPNNRAESQEKSRMNRATADAYEMGSVFKVFNTAMALDSGKVRFSESFDARGQLAIGSSRISDFHGKNRVLSLPEIFIYSSNIGSVRMAMRVGAQNQFEFFDRLGFHKHVPVELPETAMPRFPHRFSDIYTATMSFGHGIAVSPLHTAAAAVAVVNGGKYLPPTLYKRSRDEAEKVAVQVLRPETSDQMRYLFRLNNVQGSGRRADVAGYVVGGKTGTAEKITGRGYDGDKRFNSYLAAFPMDNPQYVVLTVVDEPKPEDGVGSATASMNAAPTLANIIRRIAPMLGVMPRLDEVQPTLVAN